MTITQGQLTRETELHRGRLPAYKCLDCGKPLAVETRQDVIGKKRVFYVWCVNVFCPSQADLTGWGETIHSAVLDYEERLQRQSTMTKE